MINIKGIDKAELLAALYNAAQPLGMGFVHYDPQPMAADEAREILKRQTSFDYLKGRVMKVNLAGDSMLIDLYDRDNGDGKAERIINSLRTAKAS